VCCVYLTRVDPVLPIRSLLPLFSRSNAARLGHRETRRRPLRGDLVGAVHRLANKGKIPLELRSGKLDGCFGKLPNRELGGVPEIHGFGTSLGVSMSLMRPSTRSST
jgi:hypothetical protein